MRRRERERGRDLDSSPLHFGGDEEEKNCLISVEDDHSLLLYVFFLVFFFFLGYINRIIMALHALL